MLDSRHKSLTGFVQQSPQFPKDVILFAVFFYVRYSVSYRDLEEIMAERGVRVDHATLNRWVTKYSPLVAEQARRRKRPSDRSWRMDETYIRVKGEWVYLYRAVDKFGKTLDFMLSKRRNKTAATKFFARALEVNGLPRKIVIDKSGANTAGINAINRMLRRFGCPIRPCHGRIDGGCWIPPPGAPPRRPAPWTWRRPRRPSAGWTGSWPGWTRPCAAV